MRIRSNITRTPVVPAPPPERTDMGCTITLNERQAKMLRLIIGQIGGFNDIRTELVTPLYKLLDGLYPLGDAGMMAPQPFTTGATLAHDYDVEAGLAFINAGGAE